MPSGLVLAGRVIAQCWAARPFGRRPSRQDVYVLVSWRYGRILLVRIVKTRIAGRRTGVLRPVSLCGQRLFGWVGAYFGDEPAVGAVGVGGFLDDEADVEGLLGVVFAFQNVL